MWRFWGQCTPERAALNTTRKVKLCNYSMEVFHETVKRTGVAFDGRTGGLLYLYRLGSGAQGGVGQIAHPLRQWLPHRDAGPRGRGRRAIRRWPR